MPEDVAHVAFTVAGRIKTMTRGVEQVSARLSEPAVTLHQLSGSLALVGDSLEVDLPFVGFGRSTAALRGWMQWRSAGMPAMSLQLASDTLAFGDLDSRRFERESLGDDLDRSWFVLRSGGPAVSERANGCAACTRIEGRSSRGEVLLVRHCCRPQQERRPRRGN